LLAVEKNQEAKLKSGQPCGTIESQFQMNTELSPTLVSLMKYVGNHTRPQAAEEMYHRTKVENLKKVRA